MKTLKDIFYDLNDILVALVIVALAAFVIVTNIDSILNYPTSIAEEIQMPEEETPTNYAENPTDDQQGSGDDAPDQGTTGAGVDQQDSNDQDQDTASGNGEAENYSIYINPGSTGQQIADLLIGVGLFKERQEFYNAVTAAGADGKLKAGNFIIPSDSTPAEVVSIITK
ncbi:MAG: hypothetical protein AAGU75_12275 [Bacillota bacterium]